MSLPGRRFCLALLLALITPGCRLRLPRLRFFGAPNPVGHSPYDRLAAPRSGTAWRVVGRGGAVRVEGHVPAPTQVVEVDPQGNLRVRIPPHPGSQATEALDAGTLEALQVRRAR